MRQACINCGASLKDNVAICKYCGGIVGIKSNPNLLLSLNVYSELNFSECPSSKRLLEFIVPDLLLFNGISKCRCHCLAQG